VLRNHKVTLLKPTVNISAPDILPLIVLRRFENSVVSCNVNLRSFCSKLECQFPVSRARRSF